MISKENKKWLEKDDNLKFAKYFINLGNNPVEKKQREKSIEIASTWCRIFENGEDGYHLSENLKPLLIDLLENDLKTDYETVENIWMNMCANAAQYSFAQIDDFIFTKALYGIFRVLLPEEQKIEPFDSQILDSLIKATNTDIASTKQFGVAIKSNGLKSEVIIVPDNASTWVEYGDQYRLILLQ
ncbi:MAG TPA: hypothetical protein V6C58_06180 [Allocoleopsis sp.]